MFKVTKVVNCTNAIVIHTDHERLIHQFHDAGTRSTVEHVVMVSGRPWGHGKRYEVDHADNVTPNEVFEFLQLERFCQR